MVQNFDLIMKSKSKILNCAEYFFCQPSFAGCSWPYVGGDGALPLGYLLLGWSDGILTEPCTECDGTVNVTFFGGSPLSGSCGWSGICEQCLTFRKGSGSVHSPFFEKIFFVANLRRKYPVRVGDWVECDGHIFDWGGNGLKSTRKKQFVWTQLAFPISLELLVEELSNGVERPGRAPTVELLRQTYKLKLR
ncbi:hypothetical protein BH10CYA1_BH10CYA1_52950 [soil metagenome]